MRLAYSSNAYTRTSLPLALESIASLGFKGAEVLCDRPHWFPGRVDRREQAAIRRQLERLELQISNLNANTANGYFSPPPPENVFEPALSSANPLWRRWRIDYSIEAIRLAAALGAPCISVTSGLPAAGGTPEQGLDLLVESLGEICRVAAQKQIRVGVEYEPGLLVERATELAQLLERVDSPMLGANLDIGHSYLDGESPEQAVELLAGRIWNVHVEDIRDRKHYHRVPGEGSLPFERYFSALERAGYEGFLTLELYTCSDHPEAAGRRAIEYLRTLLPDE